jgi:arylsulfatase A-like enzyme
MMSTPDRPNILWICSDQQRYDTIHALGNEHIHTPHLDRLAAEGVAFTHAHCQSPICTPSRASFLTGMYPSTIHACTNGNDYWAGAAPLVSKMLADAGYDTGLAGKLHLAGAAGRIEPRGDDGYRVFEWSHHSRNDWSEGHAYADWLRAQGVDPEIVRNHPADLPPELHQTMWCAERAIAFIEQQRSGPWLMSVNPFDPHTPFDPPAPYLHRYNAESLPWPLFRESDLAAQALLVGVDFQTTCRRPSEFDARQVKAAYYAMIELLDDAVGRMLHALERSGQRENTIVVYTSDHGEMMGDHGLLLKGCRFYEGLVRVPLIISWPARYRSGLVSDALVELTDIMPTLLDACGLPIPSRVQGRSLQAILSGASDPHVHRDAVRCEYYHVLNPQGPGGPKFVGSYSTMLRTRRHKLVVHHGHEMGELFDLENDPGEFTNLWSDPAYADVRFDLMKRSFDALAHAVDIGPQQTTWY